jgi:hypothetical protein
LKFNADNKHGKIGEAAATSLITAMGGAVKDVTDNEEMQELDIDFLACLNDINFTLECKYASIDGGADVFETIKNTNTQEKGWAYGTKADYVTIYKASINQIHIIDVSALQSWLPAVEDKYRVYYGKTYSKFYKNQILYESKNVRIPYRDLIRNNVLTNIFEYDTLKKIWLRVL